jgi:hypothetical protein
LEALDGQCINTYELDPGRDVSICEGSEEGGGSDRSRRDWCYWYAAYHKGDKTLCENVEWEEMREKCLVGGDPDNYYIISYPVSP